MAVTAQSSTPSPRRSPLGRFFIGLFSFLFVPIVAALTLAYLANDQLTTYQAAHEERVFTGISVWGVDLSGLTQAEATTALTAAAPALGVQSVTLIDSGTGVTWARSLADLGVAYDIEGAVDAAYAVGRRGDEQHQLQEQFTMWYYGTSFSPNIVIDQQYVDRWIAEIAATIDRPAADAALEIVGNQVLVTPANQGQQLDRTALRAQIVAPIANFESAELTLPITTLEPRIGDLSDAAAHIQRLIAAPVTFYFDKPADGVDLSGASISPQLLVQWLRIEWRERDGRLQPVGFIDEIAAREWIAQFSDQIASDAARARFYFDDLSQELVLIAPHVDGRSLNVDETYERFIEAVGSENRTVAFAIDEIVPTVHSGATGEDLGITELLTSATTYFAGSSRERMVNIARSASNFYGLVVAPGEQFSFNEYLGEISEEQGYTEGLIILGGQTIKGIGGGVCQVSTTLYQAAFWGGLDIATRLPHGYRVAYYENGFGPDGGTNIGMDATVYSPIVDMTFVNNTAHHLLIENYYNGSNQSLTFKFYSTDIGRRVERSTSVWNETPPQTDLYRYNPEWTGEDLNQIEWATGGADVQVHRVVYNADGDVRDEDFINSSYIPWGNVFEFGPNTASSLIPADANVEY